MSSRRVYFNGEFVAEDEARISIFDSALMYGDMVFEMTRSFGQKPYRLRDHLDRLYASIDYAEIDLEMTIDEMEEATYATIERNREALGDYDYQIMHDVTRGALGLYAELVPEGESPIVTINVIPLVRHIGGMADKYESGAHFIVPQQQSVPARYIDPKVKSRSRIFYKRADLQVSRMEEGAMALLTDERGFVTEGTGNNFFMVKEGQILTPHPHDILRGVSRAACMELAEKLGRPVIEADLEPYDVRGAEEAWFTSTSICMVPVTRFDFRPIGDGRPGPVFREILDAWSAEVGVDIAGQAREYAGLAGTWTP